MGLSWPSESELYKLKKRVSEMSGRDVKEVRVVVSPYRICPLGAHIDHQGGTVSAMTINMGILLGFVPSSDSQVQLHSGQFKGEVSFRVDEIQIPKPISKSNDKLPVISSPEINEECSWGDYARGAVYALQSRGNHLTKLISFQPVRNPYLMSPEQDPKGRAKKVIYIHLGILLNRFWWLATTRLQKMG